MNCYAIILNIIWKALTSYLMISTRLQILQFKPVTLKIDKHLKIKSYWFHTFWNTKQIISQIFMIIFEIGDDFKCVRKLLSTTVSSVHMWVSPCRIQPRLPLSVCVVITGEQSGKKKILDLLGGETSRGKYWKSTKKMCRISSEQHIKQSISLLGLGVGLTLNTGTDRKV